MNYKVRIIKTSSGKSAVQVYEIIDRKRHILKHIGTAEHKKDLVDLIEHADNWILENSVQANLFMEQNTDSYHKYYKYLGFTYRYAYEFLEQVFNKFNFHKHTNILLKDLIISQILEPSSKRQNILNLDHYFGIKHNLNQLYNQLSKFDVKLKESIEKEVMEVAKREFNFDFSFVFYDVTTLYFESFKNDEFKTSGFSKDNKHNQPQIVIGLVVTKEGFPVSYEVFKGNTFEGNTFLPIILNFKERYNIQSMTVVADSAMLSKQNLDILIKNGIDYIISARLLSMKDDVILEICRNLKKIDKESIRINNLIVEYREDRYKKDKREMDKQIEKAKKYENLNTTKLIKLKFLKNEKTKYFLNQELVERNTKLLGLKGYVTNLNIPNHEIINYYHNLFRIEHAFRIAKSDLEIRPIYHHKENSIKNHILICFICLSISLYLELKNNRSIKSIIKLLKSITDAKILNLKTGKVLRDRVNIGVVLLHYPDFTHPPNSKLQPLAK